MRDNLAARIIERIGAAVYFATLLIAGWLRGRKQ